MKHSAQMTTAGVTTRSTKLPLTASSNSSHAGQTEDSSLGRSYAKSFEIL